MGTSWKHRWCVQGLIYLAACHSTTVPELNASVTIGDVNTRFVTREAFLAAGEMQISGEPFAQAMGRNLGNYSRTHLPTDVYFDPNGAFVDLPGFSTAVESYEYSKQPMNNVAFESAAGTSMVHAPFVDVGGQGGVPAYTAMTALILSFAQGSNGGRYVTSPGTITIGDDAPQGNASSPNNILGWPGIWPTVHVFRSFDPTIDATPSLALQCSITSDDNPGSTGAAICSDFECDATSLQLPTRELQIDPTITPGADGFSGWKFGLWTMNYLQTMHDETESPVARVDPNDLSRVGTRNNTVVGEDTVGNATATGTYLGSSNIEGFQAQMFVAMMDNRAYDWLNRLSTTDGFQLMGFASTQAALAYDYGAPLQWWPSQIRVAESYDDSGFPEPFFRLSSPNSELLDLLGMAMGYATFYALTDTSNANVGGAQTVLALFDGNPFPAQDQNADGEDTLHDRALAMLRVAVVNIDRQHTDPSSGYFVDDVTMNGNMPTRGTTLSTTSAAYSAIALRQVLRSLSSQLQLYSNNTPDEAVATTLLDTLPLNYPGDSSITFSQRLSGMLQMQGDLLLNHLTDATGHACNGWSVSTGACIAGQDILDSHTAAVRGLFSMYLTTGDTRYRDRAMLVFSRLQAVFYDSGARLYTETPAPADSVDYTPVRFALLQSTLRDVYELVAAHPGQQPLASLIESRVARLNKLVLNGWDDRNSNSQVDWPQECANVVDALPRGGLQMAERTLSGETGSTTAVRPLKLTTDREQDCVPSIAAAGLPAALASKITLTVHR